VKNPQADIVQVAVLPHADLWLKYGISKPLSQEIIDACCDAFAVSREEITSVRRLPRIVMARTVCGWLLRRHTAMSFPKIGMRLGGRDHSTIMHSCRRIDALMVQYNIALHSNWRIMLSQLSLFKSLPRMAYPPRSASSGAGERG
jgi:hypothetical protein